MIVVLGVVAALVLFGAGLGLFSLRSTPQGTVKAYVAAVNDADCNKLKQLTTPELGNKLGGCAGASRTSTFTIVSMSSAISGDTAKVTALLSYDGKPSATVFSLVKPHRTWLIESVANE